jgi:uncharacterized membrane protein (DUF4010 family)
MMDYSPLHSIAGKLLAALLIGLLVGCERGWQSRTQPRGHRVAGVRTFGLLGLLGGVAGLLAVKEWKLAGAIMLLPAAVIIVCGYWRKSRTQDHASATDAVASILTLGLGAVATTGLTVEAVASACIATLLLASRRQLHGWLEALSETDIQAAARFALIAAAIWPLLPNVPFGPFGAWNARALWAVVVLVTGFSFAGYIANKQFGQKRGTIATAALGGLYSSTAVIAALSNRLRERPEAALTISAGIAVASAVMFGRVLFLTAVLAPHAWLSLATVAGPAALVAVVWAVFAARRSGGGGEADSIERDRNPVELLPAIGFALLVGFMALATRWAEQRFGGGGAALVIIITGSFDVDAAIITLGALPRLTFTPMVAGTILACPVLINTLFKAVVVLVTGGRLGWRAAIPLLVSALMMIGVQALQLVLGGLVAAPAE